ncbi:MAG: Retroviral aspartyl protease, partial [bacterium]
LGVKAYTRRPFRLADGRIVHRPVGTVLVKIAGRLVSTEVSFGRHEEQPLVGVTLLEAAGLIPDPIRRRLIPSDLLMV